MISQIESDETPQPLLKPTKKPQHQSVKSSELKFDIDGHPEDNVVYLYNAI